MKKITIIGCLFFITGCDFFNFYEKAQTQFDDQHFKTAIALIELYKIRYDHYPETLNNLTFMGEWDKIILNSVEYEKLKTGYRLDIGKGMIKAIPKTLKYPKEFWQGLGLKESNLLEYRK